MPTASTFRIGNGNVTWKSTNIKEVGTLAEVSASFLVGGFPVRRAVMESAIGNDDHPGDEVQPALALTN